MSRLLRSDDINWQQRQYSQGVWDGLSGKHGRYGNQYYQRGWRRGRARRKIRSPK